MERDKWRDQLLGGAASDNTMAAAAWSPVSGDDETQMAWSQNAPDYTQFSPVVDYPPTAPSQVSESHKPWSWAVTIVAIVLLLGAVAAVGMLIRHHGSQSLTSTPTTVTVTAAPPVLAPTPTIPHSRNAAPPAMAPDPADADDTYIAIVESNGVFVYDKVPMIQLGHQQCALLAQGETVSDAINALVAKYSDYQKDPRGAYGIVMGAVTAYCPQFKER